MYVSELPVPYLRPIWDIWLKILLNSYQSHVAQNLTHLARFEFSTIEHRLKFNFCEFLLKKISSDVILKNTKIHHGEIFA